MSHSSEGTGPELAAVDIIVFTVFADWGQEAAAPNLHKYYLVKPAAKKGVDLGDITQERVRALARSRRHAIYSCTLCRLEVLGRHFTDEYPCLRSLRYMTSFVNVA